MVSETADKTITHRNQSLPILPRPLALLDLGDDIEHVAEAIQLLPHQLASRHILAT